MFRRLDSRLLADPAHPLCLPATALLLLGFACGRSSKDARDATPAEGDADTASPEETGTAPDPFELIGSWQYTGGFPGLTDALEVTDDHMRYEGDYSGTG